MVQLNQAFDSGQHDDMNSFDPIPKDTYNMQIVESDLCVTKDKQGKYVKIVLEVTDGEYKGRRVYNNLNIVNKNPVAVDIANKELATICRACGKPVIQDTQELHGIPLKVKIRITPAKGDYPPGNAPTGYEGAGVKAKAPKKDKKPAKPEVDESSGPDWD